MEEAQLLVLHIVLHKKLRDKETGLLHDFTKKSEVIYSEIFLCKNAPAEYADRETLWNEVQKIEKK